PGIGLDHAIYLLDLAGRETFVGVEAPGARQEPLAAEDLVDPGDAAGEAVARVEDGAVRISDLRGAREPGGVDPVVVAHRGDLAEELHCVARPEGPVAQQAARDSR